jgi:hypothetical protein
MGLRDKLRRLERRSEPETVLARCEACGEEKRVRDGILLDLMVFAWQMDQEGEEELPPGAPADIRWVWGHECDPLCLRDKHTGEHIFGHVWERGVLVQRGAEGGA